MRRGSTLRSAILAPPGYKIVGSDLSQIEARMIAWLAGQHDLVQAFVDSDNGCGEYADVYCAFASKIFKRAITKADKIERQVGKVCVLGLGYSMSWVKFAALMLSGPLGADPIQFTAKEARALGLTSGDVLCKDITDKAAQVSKTLTGNPLYIHCAVSKAVVDMYRQVNSMIVRYWRQCDSMIRDMIAGRRMAYGPISTGPNCICFPNGIVLHYPHLEETDGREFRYKGRNGWERIYGGKLAENITQGLSRCVMTHQMLKIATRYKVVMTVHDEVVALAPIGDEGARQWIEDMMRTLPDWAAGLPINAEAHEGANYGDCK